MAKVSWGTRKPGMVRVYEGFYDPVPEPRQFYLRRARECDSCGEFMAKGEVAGYDECDEIVCGECFY